MPKIHIIGGPGSGKTTPANKLSKELGLEKGKRETLNSLFALLKWVDTFETKNPPEIQKSSMATPKK